MISQRDEDLWSILWRIARGSKLEDVQDGIYWESTGLLQNSNYIAVILFHQGILFSS